MTGNTIDTEIRVRYAETDAQGVVYHANYLVYFEVGRSAWLRGHGLDYSQFERDGYFLVVVEARTRYRAPARYDEVLTVRTTLSEVRHRSVTYTYQVLKDGVLVAEGETAHVCVDRAGAPTRLPPALARTEGPA